MKINILFATTAIFLSAHQASGKVWSISNKTGLYAKAAFLDKVAADVS